MEENGYDLWKSKFHTTLRETKSNLQIFKNFHHSQTNYILPDENIDFLSNGKIYYDSFLKSSYDADVSSTYPSLRINSKINDEWIEKERNLNHKMLIESDVMLDISKLLIEINKERILQTKLLMDIKKELKELKFSRSEDDKIKKLLQTRMSETNLTNCLENENDNNKFKRNIRIAHRVSEDSVVKTDQQFPNQTNSFGKESSILNKISYIRDGDDKDTNEPNREEFNESNERFESSLEDKMNIQLRKIKNNCPQTQTDNLISKVQVDKLNSEKAEEQNDNSSMEIDMLLSQNIKQINRLNYPKLNNNFKTNNISFNDQNSLLRSPLEHPLQQDSISCNESAFKKLEKIIAKRYMHDKVFQNSNVLSDERAIKVRERFMKGKRQVELMALTPLQPPPIISQLKTLQEIVM